MLLPNPPINRTANKLRAPAAGYLARWTSNLSHAPVVVASR